jgi:LemA protein
VVVAVALAAEGAAAAEGGSGLGQWLWVALLALAVFWAFGARARLAGLRQAVASGWTQVDDALRRRTAAGDELLARLRGPLAAEYAALDALLLAQRELARAAGELGARPTSPEAAAAVASAEKSLAPAASRVLALLEAHPELRGDAPLAAAVAQWRESQAQLVFACQLFNHGAQAHDAAVAQWPTRLIAPALGFRAVGRL